MLDQVIAHTLPKRGLYEMKSGFAVLKSEKAYANFFKEVCLEQNDLLDDLVKEEERFASFRKSLKEARKNYLAKIDDLCLVLKKRLDRHDTDSDDEYLPSENMYKIQRS